MTLRENNSQVVRKSSMHGQEKSHLVAPERAKASGMLATSSFATRDSINRILLIKQQTIHIQVKPSFNIVIPNRHLPKLGSTWKINYTTTFFNGSPSFLKRTVRILCVSPCFFEAPNGKSARSAEDFCPLFGGATSSKAPKQVARLRDGGEPLVGHGYRGDAGREGKCSKSLGIKR